jgi:hypothetical protein
MRRFVTLALVIVSLLSLSCYETTVSLSDPDKAKVDRSLVGDWTFPAVGDEKATTLVIRNLDDHRYYVEWFEPDKPHTRGVATLTTIKDVPFAELREITDDGSIPEKHLLMRVDIAKEKLGIRQLADTFFQDRPATTPDTLRKILETNLETETLYDGPMRYGTKQSTTP